MQTQTCLIAVSNITIASQESNYYPEQMFKRFLQQTKGIKELHLQNYFPEKLLNSARHIIQNKVTSELTNQEVFRLKKQMIKIRKELDFLSL